MFTPVRTVCGVPQCARSYARTFQLDVRGGRCEACQGDGVIKVDMQSAGYPRAGAISVKVNAITVKRWKLSTKAKPS
ncbi:hypothetical protein ACNKHR_10295 [Shigella flexneri]